MKLVLSLVEAQDIVARQFNVCGTDVEIQGVPVAQMDRNELARDVIRGMGYHAQQNKIAAIKIYRHISGASLLEAKNAVVAMLGENPAF